MYTNVVTIILFCGWLLPEGIEEKQRRDINIEQYWLIIRIIIKMIYRRLIW